MSNNSSNSKSCMIYSIVPFPVILSDRLPRFQGHGVIIDALGILCAQLTRDLFAIATFLFYYDALYKSTLSVYLSIYLSIIDSFLANPDVTLANNNRKLKKICSVRHSKRPAPSVSKFKETPPRVTEIFDQL